MEFRAFFFTCLASFLLALPLHANPFERFDHNQKFENEEQPRKRIFTPRKERLEILAASTADANVESIETSSNSEQTKKAPKITTIKKIPGIDIFFDDGMGNSIVATGGAVRVNSNSSTSFSGSASAFSASVQ